MIRALFFLIAVAAFAYLAAYLGGLDGRLTATVQGYVVDAHTGLIIGLGLFVLAVIFASAIGLKTLVDWPGKVKRKAFEARRAKGMLSLTRGLEAVAAGDATDATRLANAANRQLEEPALTRLLTAQAAQLSGDEGTAREAFTAMLAAPETEFLGRRGLYLQAMKAGDAEAAATHAERAFRLRPNAEWAFRSVFDLALERAAWGEARAALDLAQKNGVVGGEDAARSKAALLTADAYAANAAGDGQTALKEAEEAAKLAADFTPAAVLAARRLAASGKTGRAEKTLEAAWAAKPHRAIALAYGELRPKETPATKAERLTKLADLLPFHEESVLLRAEQNVALENWSAAREGLETLLTQTPTARAASCEPLSPATAAAIRE
ncbi:MAG: heme biosynthesis HemY N-terminal domain-containing protein [Pseudomonadota bacterium]